MTLLSTRLFKPVPKPYYVIREAILDFLGRHAHNPLNLVVAAAGYGKSVTISQWLDHRESKYGWISLDDDSNELRIFLDYLQTSIRESFPHALQDLTDLHDAIDLPPVKEIAGMLVNEMVRLKEEFVIVLDDYHKITNPEIHELINEVIKYPPEKLKIFILSRHDPPLRLGSLRIYERINEIRMSHLQFSPSEITSLSENLDMEKISPQLADEVYQETEGWIIGIRLILKELTDGKNILDSLKTIYREKDILSNYLIDELLEAQPEIIQKYLVQASFFERFNDSLMVHINPGGGDLKLSDPENVNEIHRFIENSMFIISLDNMNKWYRFHHLIQEFLRRQALKRYTQDEVNDFYHLASEYFENNNLFEEAIACAVEGHHLAQAIRIMAGHWDELLLRDQYARVQRWIGMLPTGASENYPSVILMRVLLNDARANYAEMKRNLDRFEVICKPLDRQSGESIKHWGEYHALRSGLNYYSGNIDCIIEHSDLAIELLSSTRSYLRDYAMLFKAFALQIRGDGNEAIRLFEEHLLTIPPDFRLGLMRSHSFLPLIHIYQADIEALKSSAKLTYEIAKEERAWVAYVMACKFLATVHYIQNNLDKVEGYIQSIANHRLAGRPLWVSHTLFYGVLSYLSSGQFEKMKQAAEDLTSFLKSFNVENFDDLAYSFQVELALRLDDLDQAEKYAAKTRYNSIPIIFAFYFTQLTEVKLLIRKGDANSLMRAHELLEKYVEIGMANRNMNFLLQVYTLLAFWHKKENHGENAVHFLVEALNIGRPSRYIRMFADYGEEMRELLMLLPEQDLSDPFVSDILYVIKEDKRRVIPHELVSGNGIETGQLDNLLTARETDILKLVGQGMQNKEIADTLFLSHETINKYLYYAYQKLGVKNRAGAVTRAKQLNLIE